MPAHPTTAVVYSLFLAIGVFSAVGDILLYKWAKAHGWAWLAGSYFFWAVSLLLFGLVFRYEAFTFTVAILICTAAHLLIDGLYDVLIVGGRMGRMEWAGAAVIVVGIAVMELGRSPTPNATQSETQNNYV